MIHYLRLTNFRRHQALEVSFTNGTQVLRGANEQGKTTVLEGISYALFGTGALRTSLDDAVTWGQDVKTLKAELILQVGDTCYQYKRSKSSAEVVVAGDVYCSGQKDVTALSASLLGADANAAARLMFASQNGLRGALEEGSKALSVLIEDLAGFSTFDEILEAAHAKLPLGSAALLEERLKGEQNTLESIDINMPAKPDESAHAAEIQAIQDQIDQMERDIPDLTLKAETASEKWSEASKVYLHHSGLRSTLSAARMNLERAVQQVTALPCLAEPDLDKVQNLKNQVLEAEMFERKVEAYAVFNHLPDGPRYDGDYEAFHADLERVVRLKDAADKEITQIDRAAALATARRINHSNCDKCGQDVTHLTSVQETNASVDAELKALEEMKVKVEGALAKWKEDLQDLNAIRQYADRLYPLTNQLQGFVDMPGDTYPSRLLWACPVPVGGADVKAIRQELAQAEMDVRTILSNNAKLELAAQQHETAQAAFLNAEKALADYPAPSAEQILELKDANDAALLNLNANKGHILVAVGDMKQKQWTFKNDLGLWTFWNSRKEDAQKRIDGCHAELDSLAYNNNLVKKLRTIRPIVANKVWSTVLNAVSVMFSQVRGEASVVTKDTNGFHVNGQSVESLSGSTLDALGLALRVALTKTFVPNCNFLVLDEPAAGMDAERTEKMLGFLQSTGFTQTLLVTHEDISSSIANNIVEV